MINEDDENKVNKGTVIKKEPVEPSESETQNVAEHDIFGGAVSDSEDESQLNVLELDENSQNSAEDSHLTDSNSIMVALTPKSLDFFKLNFLSLSEQFGRIETVNRIFFGNVWRNAKYIKHDGHGLLPTTTTKCQLFHAEFEQEQHWVSLGGNRAGIGRFEDQETGAGVENWKNWKFGVEAEISGYFGWTVAGADGEGTGEIWIAGIVEASLTVSESLIFFILLLILILFLSIFLYT